MVRISSVVAQEISGELRCPSRDVSALTLSLRQADAKLSVRADSIDIISSLGAGRAVRRSHIAGKLVVLAAHVITGRVVSACASDLIHRIDIPLLACGAQAVDIDSVVIEHGGAQHPRALSFIQFSDRCHT